MESGSLGAGRWCWSAQSMRDTMHHQAATSGSRTALTRSGSTTQPSACAQGATMYDIDFDTASDTIKGLRKAVKGVQVMCAVVVEFLGCFLWLLHLAAYLQQKRLHVSACFSKMACVAMLLSHVQQHLFRTLQLLHQRWHLGERTPGDAHQHQLAWLVAVHCIACSASC